MIGQPIGPIQFIPGENRGRYPYCNSIYIEEAGILIDPASDRKTLIELRDTRGVRQVWLSHWHEDHFMHLDLFEDIPFWISERDHPPLTDLETLLDWYDIENPDYRAYWTRLLEEQFHYRPRRPTRFFQDGEIIDLGALTVEVIPTPGHTPGHLVFYFREPKVLFLGDYDLTSFGPWYGDRYSNIDETILSIKHLKKIPAAIWLTGHENRIFESSPGDLWDQYAGVIDQREDQLLDLLREPKSLVEIAKAYIVYGRPREPKEFFEFGERAIMKKHLERLEKNGRVVQNGKNFQSNQ